MCGTLIASDFADPLWHNAQRLGSACCADAFAGFRAAMIMRAAAAPRQKCKADYGSDQPAYLAAVGHPDFGAFIRFGRFCPSLASRSQIFRSALIFRSSLIADCLEWSA